MDRYQRYGYYARAWATGAVTDGAPLAAWVAEAIGARNHHEEPLATVDELDAELRRVGVLPAEDDEPDPAAVERDERQTAEAQARLARIVGASGGSLLDAAADEIGRLRVDMCQSANARAGLVRELQQGKEALEQARAVVQSMHSERDAVMLALEVRSGETLLDAARRLRASVDEQAASIVRLSREAHEARFPSADAAGAALAEARERGAAEMRERAAAYLTAHADGDVGLLEIADRIRALPLSPAPQAESNDGADARCAATARVLLAMGIPAARVDTAVRIAEEEGGAAPETAHSACMRIAKADGPVGFFNEGEHAADMLRRRIQHMIGQSAAGERAAAKLDGLSPEDAETLRGARTWVNQNVADGLEQLRLAALALRAAKAPAAAHGPGRVTGEDSAAGSSSVAPSPAAPQGLPRPPSVEVGHRWDNGNLVGPLLVESICGDRDNRVVLMRSESEKRNATGAAALEHQMLDGHAWTFLGPAPAPQGPRRDGEGEAPVFVPGEERVYGDPTPRGAYVVGPVSHGAPAAELATAEPTARDAVAGMLLRRGLPTFAAGIATGAIQPTSAAMTVRWLDGVASADDRVACIAALEALARGDLRGARDHVGLTTAIDSCKRALQKAVALADKLTRELDEARADVADLESTCDRVWDALGTIRTGEDLADAVTRRLEEERSGATPACETALRERLDSAETSLQDAQAELDLCWQAIGAERQQEHGGVLHKIVRDLAAPALATPPLRPAEEIAREMVHVESDGRAALVCVDRFLAFADGDLAAQDAISALTRLIERSRADGMRAAGDSAMAEETEAAALRAERDQIQRDWEPVMRIERRADGSEWLVGATSDDVNACNESREIDGRVCLCFYHLAGEHVSTGRHDSGAELITARWPIAPAQDEQRATSSEAPVNEGSGVRVNVGSVFFAGREATEDDKRHVVEWLRRELEKAMHGENRSHDEIELLHSADERIRLAMPKDADPRAVLATVAELLGLTPGPMDAPRQDETVEQIRSRADWHTARGEYSEATKLSGYAGGLREGERRAKAKAEGLVRQWEADRRATLRLRDAVEPTSKTWARRGSSAATRRSCILWLCDAFDIEAPPTDGQPPTGGEPAPEDGGFIPSALPSPGEVVARSATTGHVEHAPPAADERWQPGATWEHDDGVSVNAQRYALLWVSADDSYVCMDPGCDIRAQIVRRSAITEANGWRYVGRPASETRAEEHPVVRASPAPVDRAALLALAEGWEREADREADLAAAAPSGSADRARHNAHDRMLGRCASDLRRLLDAPRGPGGREREPEAQLADASERLAVTTGGDAERIASAARAVMTERDPGTWDRATIGGASVPPQGEPPARRGWWTKASRRRALLTDWLMSQIGDRPEPERLPLGLAVNTLDVDAKGWWTVPDGARSAVVAWLETQRPTVDGEELGAPLVGAACDLLRGSTPDGDVPPGPGKPPASPEQHEAAQGAQGATHVGEGSREHVASMRSTIAGLRDQLEQRMREIARLQSKLRKARAESTSPPAPQDGSRVDHDALRCGFRDVDGEPCGDHVAAIALMDADVVEAMRDIVRMAMDDTRPPGEACIEDLDRLIEYAKAHGMTKKDDGNGPHNADPSPLGATESVPEASPEAKPQNVWPGQWWARRGDDGRMGVELCVDDPAEVDDDLIGDPRWVYLGDGPRPRPTVTREATAAPDREQLGREVHEASTNAAKWGTLGDIEREACRRIGERLYGMGAQWAREELDRMRAALEAAHDTIDKCDDSAAARRAELEQLRGHLEAERATIRGALERLGARDGEGLWPAAERVRRELEEASARVDELEARAVPRLVPVSPGPLAELADRIAGYLTDAFSEPGDGELRGRPVAIRVLQMVDEHIRAVATPWTSTPETSAQDGSREIQSAARRARAKLEVLAAVVDPGATPDADLRRPRLEVARRLVAEASRELDAALGAPASPDPAAVVADARRIARDFARAVLSSLEAQQREQQAELAAAQEPQRSRLAGELSARWAAAATLAELVGLEPPPAPVLPEAPAVGVDLGTGPATTGAVVLERQPDGTLRPLATFEGADAERRAREFILGLPADPAPAMGVCPNPTCDSRGLVSMALDRCPCGGELVPVGVVALPDGRRGLSSADGPAAVALAAPGSRAENVTAPTRPGPRIELRDGAEVTVESYGSNDCAELGPVHRGSCTVHIDGHHVSEGGRADRDNAGSWHVLERWPIAPAKPPAVAPGQRWTCVGVDGVLVVHSVEPALGPRGPRVFLDGGNCTAREADMLGLREWRWVG